MLGYMGRPMTLLAFGLVCWTSYTNVTVWHLYPKKQREKAALPSDLSWLTSAKSLPSLNDCCPFGSLRALLPWCAHGANFG